VSVDAAKGMGMNSRQRLWSVELPLALPVVLAGVRIALVQTTAGAIIAALVGGGGLGRIVFYGLEQTAEDLVLVGVLPIGGTGLSAGHGGAWTGRDSRERRIRRARRAREGGGMIELERVTKRYADVAAVDDLSLVVEEGEFAILLGPSGCGKTTTLRSINRMVEIDHGAIRIDGVDIKERQPDDLRRHIGYGIQSVGLFPHMTVARNIGVVPRLLGWDDTKIAARVSELLEMVGLDPKEYARKKAP